VEGEAYAPTATNTRAPTTATVVMIRFFMRSIITVPDYGESTNAGIYPL
jgi:hypothetical protein